MPESRSTISSRLRRIRLPGLRQVSVLYLLVGIFILYSLWVPETFLTTLTMKSVGADQVVVAILALAVLIAMTAGVFDISVGSMMAFSLVIISRLQQDTHLNVVLCCAIAIAACAVAGFVNGLIIVRFRVDSFIATLGTGQLLSAAALYLSKSRQITGVFSDSFLSAGRREVLGLPIVIYYLLGIALITWYVLAWTRLGRNMFATGANREAARLAGLRTDRLIWGSLIASAVMAGIAGLIFGAKVGTYSSSTGVGLLFPAFAAVFLGATQFKKRPNTWGTLLAVYALAFGVKGLQLAIVEGVYWITPAFNGLALIVAVAIAVQRGAGRSKAMASDAHGTAEPASTEVDGELAIPPVVAHPPAGDLSFEAAPAQRSST